MKRTFLFAIDERAKVPQMCPSGKSVLTFWAVLPKTLELCVNSPTVTSPNRRRKMLS